MQLETFLRSTLTIIFCILAWCNSNSSLLLTISEEADGGRDAIQSINSNRNRNSNSDTNDESFKSSFLEHIRHSNSTERILTSKDVADTVEDGFYLKKHAFDNRTRILIFVGLEGSGLRVLRSMFHKCIATNPYMCKAHSRLSKMLLRPDSTNKHTVHGLFSAEDADRSYEYVESIKKTMHQLSTPTNPSGRGGPVSTRAGDGGLFILCTGFRTATKGDSYTPLCGAFPCSRGEHRPSDHPDLFTLSIVAETAGADLRVNEIN
jgi:hypothetical protein